MNKRRRIATLTAFVMSTALCFGPCTALAQARLTYGLAGHPWLQRPPEAKQLWGDPQGQLATLQEHGLQTYRFPVVLSDNHASAMADLQQLVDLAAAHHVTLHPTLIVPFTYGDATDGGKYPRTDSGLESQGYQRVYPVVLRFAAVIHDWELENELDLKQGFKNGGRTAPGMLADDYTTPVAHQWAAVLRGMSRAVSDARSKTHQPLRSVVDFASLDFGLIPFLESQKVLVDVAAYHYYYGLGADPYRLVTPQNTRLDLFSELRDLQKPVIIDELNAGEIHAPRQGKPYDDAKALQSLKKHIEYIVNQTEAPIEGIEFYELYDEPWKDAVESNFGFMSDPDHPKAQMLLATVYACGHVSDSERATLVAKGLFTENELAAKLATCGDKPR